MDNSEAEERDQPESEPEHSEEISGGSPESEPTKIKPDPLENLSDEELDRLTDQYIHYGEVAIETSNQRVQMNRFFGLILTSILAGLFALAQTSLSTIGAVIVLFASVSGTGVCYFWYQSLQSYRRLNKARYAILNEIESVLPVKMYLDEWRYLKRDRPDPEIIEPRPAKDSDHRSHTLVEQWFVRLLASGYLAVGGYATGFIFTPDIGNMFNLTLSRPTVGLAGGVLVLAGSTVLYWYLSR